MLKNGLGELLTQTIATKRAFFDLFCGGGSVSAFVAQSFEIPVHSSDLQEYAVALTRAHVEREMPFSHEHALREWNSRAINWIGSDASLLYEAKAYSFPMVSEPNDARRKVAMAKAFCGDLPPRFPISRSYGGYYFSPEQALTIDALRASIPDNYKSTALAALIRATSSCAASPGHTAQPFSTTDSALPYLCEAWRRNVGAKVERELEGLAHVFARKRGAAERKDAIESCHSLTEHDIAFIDPPYSEVQYSRFYHVLEAVATARAGEVFGTGRYPPLSERPQSNFCKKSCSFQEFETLMIAVAAGGAEAIVTFPAGTASNGLSGESVEAVSAQFFKVQKRKVASIFSTLGGNSVGRSAREQTTELVLHLVPR